MKKAHVVDWTITAPGLAPPFVDTRLPREEEITVCARWINLHVEKSKYISSKRSSYGYKHDAERWSAALGELSYVTNGAFIEAARRLGFTVKRCADGSPNAYFNMKRKKDDVLR